MPDADIGDPGSEARALATGLYSPIRGAEVNAMHTIRRVINGDVYMKQLIDDNGIETTSPPCYGAVTAAEVGRMIDDLFYGSLSAIEADAIRRMLGMTPSEPVAEQPAPPNAGDMDTKTAGDSVNFGKLDWERPDYEDMWRRINRAGQVAQPKRSPADWEERAPGVVSRCHVGEFASVAVNAKGWCVYDESGGRVLEGPETGDLGRECADQALVRRGVLPSSRAFAILSDWKESGDYWVRRDASGLAVVTADAGSRAEVDAGLVAAGKLSRGRAYTDHKPLTIGFEARSVPRMNDWSGDAHYPEPSYGRSAGRLSTDLRVSASVSAIGWHVIRDRQRVAGGKESGALGQECADDVLVKLGCLESERAVRLWSDWRIDEAGRSTRKKIGCDDYHSVNCDSDREWVDAQLVARGELAPSRAFKGVETFSGEKTFGPPVWNTVRDNRMAHESAERLRTKLFETAREEVKSAVGQTNTTGVLRQLTAAHEKDLANAAYRGSASVLSALQKPANPLYDQDKSPISPGIFVEVSPPVENADAVWEVRAVNYTTGVATLRQPRGQSWRLADVPLKRLAIVPKPTTWNALAGLADWERTIAAIMANPPVTALEMGQKKGVAWERFLVGLADVYEVISWRAGHAKAVGDGDYLRDEWSVGAVLEWAGDDVVLRKDGWKGHGYPGQQQRDYTHRATR